MLTLKCYNEFTDFLGVTVFVVGYRADPRFYMHEKVYLKNQPCYCKITNLFGVSIIVGYPDTNLHQRNLTNQPCYCEITNLCGVPIYIVFMDPSIYIKELRYFEITDFHGVPISGYSDLRLYITEMVYLVNQP